MLCVLVIGAQAYPLAVSHVGRIDGHHHSWGHNIHHGHHGHGWSHTHGHHDFGNHGLGWGHGAVGWGGAHGWGHGIHGGWGAPGWHGHGLGHGGHVDHVSFIIFVFL